MARPPSTNPACAWLGIRCTPADKAAIRQRAEAAGLTMSEYILGRALDRETDPEYEGVPGKDGA